MKAQDNLAVTVVAVDAEAAPIVSHEPTLEQISQQHPTVPEQKSQGEENHLQENGTVPGNGACTFDSATQTVDRSVVPCAVDEEAEPPASQEALPFTQQDLSQQQSGFESEDTDDDIRDLFGRIEARRQVFSAETCVFPEQALNFLNVALLQTSALPAGPVWTPTRAVNSNRKRHRR
jgi:hypothetical protein